MIRYGNIIVIKVKQRILKSLKAVEGVTSEFLLEA